MATSKSKSVDITVIIPAYNEQDRLVPTLATLRSSLSRRAVEVLVVDDGSRDRTAALVSAAVKKWKALRLVRQKRNQGKGAAVARGVLLAKGKRVLFTDADLSTPIDQMAKLEAKLNQGFDMAIGSRALAKSRIVKRQPLYRHLGGKAFNQAVRLLTVGGFADTQCGFKMFTREAGQKIFRLQRVPGFGFDVEMLYLARKFGLKVAEVPVSWVNSEESKVSLAAALGTFGDLLAIRRHDLAGHYQPGPPKKGGDFRAFL